MVSVHRYHEISESSHRILNPISTDKVLQLGEICRIGPGTRVLDLACGKGEMLCLFAERFGASGVGIDIYAPFLAVARERAIELGVSTAVTLVEGDASDLDILRRAATTIKADAPESGIQSTAATAVGGDVPDRDAPGGTFDLVSCIGATWIGGGLTGTLALMTQQLRASGWLLVGEVYWAADPPASVRERHIGGEGFADLGGTLERFEAAGLDLVEMLLASPDEWDRYAASQWLNVSEWLLANPEDPDAPDIREERDTSRRSYLNHERGCLGWGVFVLRC